MECDYCHLHFEPRRTGRKQRFCPGGDCRQAYNTKARKVGDRVIQGRKRDRRSSVVGRLTDIEAMEKEAELAGHPGMFIRPAAARRALVGAHRDASLPTIADLGLAAMRRGVLRGMGNGE